MTIEDKKLFILPFPQRILVDKEVIENNKLICNVLVLPRNDPFEDLVLNDDLTAFTSASFSLKAWVVKDNSDKLPVSSDHAADADYRPEHNLIFQNKNREEIFNAIAAQFDIDTGPAPLSGKLSVTLKKYLPVAYRNAFTFSQPRNDNAVTDDSYFCSLKTNNFANPYVRNDKVNWAQILAFALSQPMLATALGILYNDVEIPLESADFFKEGGWVYFDFDETDDVNTTLHLTGNDTIVQYYAARIPAAIESRQAFAPVLFPVLHVDEFGNEEATVPFDDVFKDVVQYDDGFAKIVHCSQAVNTNPILETKEGPSPLMDTGIRLGWDDEQILTWMNRSFADTHLPPGDQKAHSKLTVSRYRIDVAEISQAAFDSDDISLTENETEGNWKSQVAITSKETLNLTADIPLGDYEGEAGIQVSPARSNDNERQMWLPAFFAFWNGASLAIPDAIPEEINNI